MGTPQDYIQVLGKSSIEQRAEAYKEKLEPYNTKMYEASLALVAGPSEASLAQEEVLQNQADTLMQEVR